MVSLEEQGLMQKSVTGMTVNRGFTLIEILIVIVIIGITVGFAVIAFGDFGESKRLLFSADQLSNTLKLAQQQAILDSSTLGLRIDNTSYQILKFQNSSEWQPIPKNNIFKVYYFPQNTVITLKTNNSATGKNPAIIINASGDMTPFSIGFGTDKENNITTLHGGQDGSLYFTSTKPK